jgi:hypothetical protein
MIMFRIKLFFGWNMLLCSLVFQAHVNGQDGELPVRARLMFYNFENLFDPYDDSLKRDDEFLPGGSRNWTYSRMLRKIDNIFKVIAATGEWDAPALAGCCEVENSFVLDKLVYQTPLKKFGYRYVHRESPDPRGIDVALLYRPDLFEPIDTSWLAVCPPTSSACSREILHLKGRLMQGPELHVFVNHWPSRYGGPAETIEKRAYAARILRNTLDSILQDNPYANILIMGDFNDEPSDESLRYLVGQLEKSNVPDDWKLINLMDFPYYNTLNSGTIKSAGVWGIFDQMIVSKSLLEGLNGIKIQEGRAKVMSADFLLVPDEKNLGNKPFRSFQGYYFTGGFSDHLPVYLDLEKTGEENRQY